RLLRYSQKIRPDSRRGLTSHNQAAATPRSPLTIAMSSPSYNPAAAHAASHPPAAAAASASSASAASSSTTGSSHFAASSSLSSLAAPKPSLLASSRSLSGSAAGGGGSAENLPPRTLARVARDVRDLVQAPPEGVRLVLDGETGMPGSLSEILVRYRFAEIEGPEQTPYSGRYFRLKLVLSADFPATPPRGYFLTKIYHPNVDPSTGAICVNTLKKDWTATTSLSHVLTVIRCLMIVPFPESSLNDEAGKNFMESYDEYARRARLLAGVHGLTSWSSAAAGGGKSEGLEGKDSDGEGSKKPLATASSNGAAGGGSSGGSAKLGKAGNRGNIVRAGSKTLDKKSKKKSLRRL
ncbi:hypothetical protein ACHAXT_011837, partial [Thalassiosira profunda]